MPSCTPLCSVMRTRYRVVLAKKLKSQTIIKPIKAMYSEVECGTQQRDLERFNCFEDADRDTHLAWKHQLRLLLTTRLRRISLFSQCLSSSHRILRLCIPAFDYRLISVSHRIARRHQGASSQPDNKSIICMTLKSSMQSCLFAIDDASFLVSAPPFLFPTAFSLSSQFYSGTLALTLWRVHENRKSRTRDRTNPSILGDHIYN